VVLDERPSVTSNKRWLAVTADHGDSCPTAAEARYALVTKGGKLEMFQFIKSTILGGILFLIPVVILIMVFGKAYQLVRPLAEPISSLFPIEHAFGLPTIGLLAIAVLLLICFFFGLAAKTSWTLGLISALEKALLSKLPGYDYMKMRLSAELEFKEEVKSIPVLARLGEGQWRVGFEMERISGGYVVVYLPGAPDPWSGTVNILTDDRITPLESKKTGTLHIFRDLGKGTGGIVQTVLE
jgi:uncharacterized membrane protein